MADKCLGKKNEKKKNRFQLAIGAFGTPTVRMR